MLRIENKIIRLDLDNKNDGILTVSDKRSGKVWKGYGAAIVACAWHDRYNLCLVQASSVPETVETEFGREKNDSLWARYTFAEKEVQFTVHYSLVGDCLKVWVPLNKIKDAIGNNGHLYYIDIMPCFGAVPEGEDGYLVLPAFGGALRYFGKKHIQKFRPTKKQVVYRASQPFAVNSIFNYDSDGPREAGIFFYDQPGHWGDNCGLPLFGVVHGKSAFMAFPSKGEFDAELIIRTNQGKKHWNSVHNRFHFRYESSENIDRVDRELRYIFLSGEEASYSGMACRYRNYLIKEKGICTLKEKVKTKPLINYFHNCYNLKVLFGFKTKGRGDLFIPNPKGNNSLKKFLSYKKVEKLLVKLKNAGVEKANVCLVGWNREGHDGCYPTLFPIEERFGTKGDFKKLIAQAKKLDYRITVHVNYYDCYKRSPEWSEEYIQKNRDGSLQKGGIWAGGQAYRCCPKAMLECFIKRDIPKIKALGFDGVFYFDVAMSTLYPCYDKKHPLNRRQFAQAVKDYLMYARKMFGGVSTELGMADMLDSVDLIYHLPFPLRGQRAKWISDSNLYKQGLIHELVPLAVMIYHGLIQYSLANPEFGVGSLSFKEQRLHDLELGALPRDEWRNNKPEARIPKEAETYKHLCKNLGHLQLEFIESHRMVQPQVFQTRYSNGTRVIVNYNRDAFTVESIKIPGKGYRILN